MIPQNLTLCFTLACLAGLCHISGRAVVLKQVQREKQRQGHDGTSTTASRQEKLFSSLLFFGLECSAHVTYFFAPWFGPVSLVLPTEIASRLLFNVLILGGILHHETFGKMELVGTAMVALAVVYLPITGPREPEQPQDLLEIVTKPIALIWLGLVLVVYGTAVTLMLCLDLKTLKPCYTEGILLAVAACSYLGNTVSKLASLAGDYGTLYSALLMGFGVLITVIWIMEVMKEPLYIRSFATYTPLNTGLGLVFSLLTGVRIFVRSFVRSFVCFFVLIIIEKYSNAWWWWWCRKKKSPFFVCPQDRDSHTPCFFSFLFFSSIVYI
jgi:hypothetical protein